LLQLNRVSRPVTIDTLYVEGVDHAPSGTPIDEYFYPLFLRFYMGVDLQRGPQIFATYRIDLDARHTAYLLRVPGAYAPTAIDLWVYDSRDSSFARPINVADTFGDGGTVVVTVGWLVDFNGDAHRDLVPCRHYQTYDTSNDGRLLSERDELSVRLWSDTGFTRPQSVTDSTRRARFTCDRLPTSP
jgi:hypothetical protein